MVGIQDLQYLIQIQEMYLVVLKVVHVHISQVTVVVEDVMVQDGIGIQDMEVHTHIQWAETIRTKVILAEAEWCRYHGHKYIQQGNKGKLNGRCRNQIHIQNTR